MNINEHRSLKQIPVVRLIPHPDNPRKDLGDLSELTESVKTVGILQNLTVTPAELVEGVKIPEGSEQYYVVIIGHRRLAAAKAAGLETVPCADVSMDRKEQLSTMLLENMQRSDLTVYEQAWGFQQMTILGCTVEEISEKSGFSQSTVRRRLKIAELDQKILKKVSSDEGRQLSLGDFDKLAEIEDLKLRNTVLKDIGTSDFNQKLAAAKRKERVAANMPKVKEWLKEHSAKQISNDETYGSRYTNQIGDCGWYSYISIEKFGTKDGKKMPTKKALSDKQLYYTMFDDYFSLYVENPNIGSGNRGKKTEKEKARDRIMKEVRAKVKELSSLHYTMRKDFIEAFTVTKSNRDKVIAGTLAPALYFAGCGGSHLSKSACAAINIREYEYNTDKILQGLDSVQENDLARAVYSVYNDNAENWFADDMLTPATIPHYDPKDCNVKLNLLYRWLVSLGYEMSTDEKALMDGSHEVYHRKVATK